MALPNACPKPLKGSLLLEQRTRRSARARAEESVKVQVRARDQMRCRFPHCTEAIRGVRIEVAHLDDKGMGGDKRLVRTQRDRMLCLCFLHHQGRTKAHPSLHSGDLKVEPDTSRGTDGLCAFWVSDEQRQWRCVGIN